MILLGAFTWWEYQLRYTAPTLEPEPARAGVSYLLAEPIVVDGQSYLVDPEEIVFAGAGRDSIPALESPVYESVFAADSHLSDEGYGILVEVYGQAYFYPLVIMSWHEIVNDTITGVPLSITYCPLCRSSVVFERAVDDQVLDFGTTGQVLNNNLVMYDRQTDSMWGQLLGQAIVSVGTDARQGVTVGTELIQYPSTQITFGQFKELYPYGSVLSRSTGYDRDYTQDPYWQYHESDEIWLALSTFDGRAKAKDQIYGVHQGVESASAHTTWVENSIPSYWFCWVAAYPGTEVKE